MSDGASGSGPYHRPLTFENVMHAARDCRSWFGFSLFLAVMNLIIGIVLLSKVPAKKEVAIFSLTVLGTVISLGHFAAICYLFQHRLEQKYGEHRRDPELRDVGGCLGVALLFVLCGLMMTVELPSHCYAGNNDHFKALGKVSCSLLTTMAVFAWLAVLLMVISGIVLYREVCETEELSKQPLVYPEGANPEVMRWLARSGTIPSLSAVQGIQSGWRQANP